jgi:hypothetical protein
VTKGVSRGWRPFFRALCTFKSPLRGTPVPGENGAMRKFLRYITNNEAVSRHEEVFDGIFWVIETAALIFGIWILKSKHSAEWIPFLVIEYCWAMDNLRHNRP